MILNRKTSSLSDFKKFTIIVVHDDNQELLEDEPFFELNSVSGNTEIFYY